MVIKKNISFVKKKIQIRMFKLKKIDKSLRYLCLRMYMLSWFTSEEVFGGGRVNILPLFWGEE